MYTCKIPPENTYILSKIPRKASEVRILVADTKYLLLRNTFRQIRETTTRYEKESQIPGHPRSANDQPYIVLTVNSSVIKNGMDAFLVSSETSRFEIKSGKNSSAK